jgi:hypothetical protein
LQRLGQIALACQHRANPVLRHRQIALPSGVAGVGLRQPLLDRKPVAEGFERLGQIALLHQPVAEPFIRHR